MFEKIQLLQEKHDTEIELLASELNLQSHFIKVKFMFIFDKNQDLNLNIL